MQSPITMSNSYSRQTMTHSSTLTLSSVSCIFCVSQRNAATREFTWAEWQKKAKYCCSLVTNGTTSYFTTTQVLLPCTCSIPVCGRYVQLTQNPCQCLANKHVSCTAVSSQNFQLIICCDVIGECKLCMHIINRCSPELCASSLHGVGRVAHIPHIRNGWRVYSVRRCCKHAGDCEPQDEAQVHPN